MSQRNRKHQSHSVFWQLVLCLEVPVSPSVDQKNLLTNMITFHAEKTLEKKNQIIAREINHKDKFKIEHFYKLDAVLKKQPSYFTTSISL